MSKSIEVMFSLQGFIREDAETSCYVSYCPALDLYSAAKTRHDAKKALQGAIDLYVRLSYQRGILGEVLRAKGFDPTQLDPMATTTPTPTIENFISVTESDHASEYDDDFTLQVPMYLVAAAQNAKAGRACLS